MQGRTIESSRLKVEIAMPGMVYDRSRFDWTGFVTQVTLDGNHTYCTIESFISGDGTGGIGLCNSFEPFNNMGFDEAGVGDTFSKIGIGILKRFDDGPYSSFKNYEITPYPYTVSSDGTSLTFKQESIECKGYAYTLVKTYSVVDNMLYVKYKLTNVGKRAIDCEEYAHNFLNIDNTNIGPDYELRLPYTPELDMQRGSIVKGDRELTWDKTPDGAFYCFIRNFKSYAPHYWELVNKKTGAGVRETSAFPVTKFNFWGVAHVASPEVFIKIDVDPGKYLEWTREYMFFA